MKINSFYQPMAVVIYLKCLASRLRIRQMKEEGWEQI